MALDRLRAGDIGIALLLALAKLEPREREMWIDQYVLGRSPRDRVSVASANRKLRDHFGTIDNLRRVA